MIHELASEIRSQIHGNGEPSRTRMGVVQVVNGDGTVDVTIGGESLAVPGVNHLAAYQPQVGDTVWISVSGPDLLVIGRTATGPTDTGHAHTEYADTGHDHAGAYVTPANRDTLVAALRSQVGGFVANGEQFRWQNGRLYWTGRLISISHGSGTHWSNGGWYGFYCPAPNSGGTIPGYGGHGGFTIDGAEGIPLGSHQALYGVPTIGGGPTDTSLALVTYTAGFVVPDHWVLIAVASESDGRVMLGNGTLLDSWRPLTYANGWATYSGYWPASAYKDTAGWVHLRGLIQGGSVGGSTTACLLPVGYRPAAVQGVQSYNIHYSVRTNSGTEALYIRGGGEIIKPDGTNIWVDLASVPPFLAEQ